MGKSLSTTYRPSSFDDVIGQEIIVKILKRQIEEKAYNNAYLFYGPSGCGKTTLARIFANGVNSGKGNPIEIDAASNNGVENVKRIVQESRERSVDSEYKIFILDECHSLTTQAWQAFLKCIEETPRYTIFIFCTTEYNKVPTTIRNRSIELSLNKVDPKLIENRLLYICREEGFLNYEDACNYIAKTCNGRVRDAISTLEKCALSDKDMSKFFESLNVCGYSDFFELLNFIIDGKEADMLNKLKNILLKYNSQNGFVTDYLSFVMDISKYLVCEDMSLTKMSSGWIQSIKNVMNFDGAVQYYSYLSGKLIDLKKSIAYMPDSEDFIYFSFLSMTRCV